MEFKMTTDLSTAMKPQVIAFNYEELKAELAGKLAKYKGLLVTEDGLAEAKKDRALLRKVRDALNAEKITVKKQWMGPYTDFEGKVKELMEMCDEPAREIDEQVKRFEERKKQEKKEALAACFQEHIGEASEYVPFELIFDQKWLNATVTLEEAQDQIIEICERYNEDTAVLRGMCEEADPSIAATMKRAYKATRSLTNVIQVKQEIEREIKRMEEQRRAEAEAKQAKEEQKEEAASFAMPDMLLNAGHRTEEQEPEMIELCFRVKCTKEQLDGLKRYIVTNHIWYGKV